jgi:hypothetical protein
MEVDLEIVFVQPFEDQEVNLMLLGKTGVRFYLQVEEEAWQLRFVKFQANLHQADNVLSEHHREQVTNITSFNIIGVCCLFQRWLDHSHD